MSVFLGHRHFRLDDRQQLYHFQALVTSWGFPAGGAGAEGSSRGRLCSFLRATEGSPQYPAKVCNLLGHFAFSKTYIPSISDLYLVKIVVKCTQDFPSGPFLDDPIRTVHVRSSPPHSSRSLSCCKTETPYLLNNNSSSPHSGLPCPWNSIAGSVSEFEEHYVPCLFVPSLLHLKSSRSIQVITYGRFSLF